MKGQPVATVQSLPLQVGIQVMLNSGGPWMTVSSVTDDGGARVRWFDGEKRVHRDLFPKDSLRQKTAMDDVTCIGA